MAGTNQITFTDKVNSRTLPIPSINKVRDVDLNEIKQEHNALDNIVTDPVTGLVKVVEDLGCEIRENNSVLFDKNYITGCQGTPRTGNITFDFTGAKLGSVTVFCINDSVLPTTPSENVIISGEFVPDVDNYYLFMIVKTTSTQQVLSTICQEI
jgi:hypothetical protein